MEKAISCVKMVTIVYISCRNLLMVYEVIIWRENRISTDKNTIRQGIFAAGHWQYRRIMLEFSRKKLWWRHALTERFPERVPLWCKASVPLPTAIPLPSRGEEMPRRVRPLKRQWVAHFLSNQGGTVEYCLFVSHPWFFQGMGIFYTFPAGREWRIQN